MDRFNGEFSAPARAPRPRNFSWRISPRVSKIFGRKSWRLPLPLANIHYDPSGAMSRDFFLLNRCFQVAKICRQPAADSFAYPPPNARHKLPPQLQKFFGLLDRMCAIANADEMPHANAELPNVPVALDQNQRRDLEEFERVIVALRFNADEQIKRPAVSLLRAIFADAHYFSGLKPLPQYTETFAYELLFPSWLNLLSAAMLPRADNGKPKLEGMRQGELFEFLGTVEHLDDHHKQLMIGYMSFIASRFDAPLCEDLLQRLVDLAVLQDAAILDAIDEIDLACKDARQFKQAIRDYLVVMTSLADSGAASQHHIAYQRPSRRALPEVLAASLTKHAQGRDWPEFLSIAGPVRAIVESKHSLAPEMVGQLTNRPESLVELLGLIATQASDGPCVLSEEAQSTLAVLITAQASLLDEHFTCLQAFAGEIAPRLNGFGETTLECFQRILIDDDAGRLQLLESLQDSAARGVLVDKLQQRAAATDSDSRWLCLLGCASVLWTDSQASESRASLQAIAAVISNRTIGDKEQGDLLDDLRTEPLRALERLASPMMAAVGKGPRVAALYLTLNEVSQKLSSTGAVDNFSVVRAKYSRLTNMDIDLPSNS